jgi:PAS domain S-box-containing protein/diguanylate cyclase (GGDEF)-like protein
MTSIDTSFFPLATALIVDDDNLVRKSLYFNLKEQLGFKEIYTARDGNEALELYCDFRPDVVITDITMPEMDGLELASKLREVNEEVAIIILTAYDDSDLVIKAINKGVNNFLVKPLNIDMLKKSLTKILSDVFGRQRYRKTNSILEHYKKIVDASNIVSMTDGKGVITYVNEKFCQVSKYNSEELIGKPHNIVRHPETPKEAFRDMWETIKSGEIWHGVLKNRAKDGTTYIVDSTISPIYTHDGEFEGYLAIRHDLTDLFLQEETIKRQTHDTLTGLGNRVKLVDDIKASKSPYLAVINIDDFSSINETFGTNLGDNVIKDVAKRIVTLLPSGNFIPYRVYADEFAVLCDLEDEELKDDFFGTFIKRLSGAPYFIESQEISLSFTAGIAQDHVNLINRANFAYKHAKQNKVSIYKYDDHLKKLDGDREANIKWIIELKRAIQEDDIIAFFQPIRNIKNGDKIEKFESLVRLRKSDKTIVSPYFFLDIAKRAKLYSHITRIMFDRVVDALQKHKEYEFSINLSMLDIANKDIMDYIYKEIELLEKEDSKRLVFELTEQESLDYDAIVDFSKKIKCEHGCKIAIDDFGSGYSNFEHLIELDMDYLKIDGSIIKRVVDNEDSRILTEAIVDFSKKLRLKTIAEFVSSQEIFDTLQEIGIDYIQGFHGNGEPREKI